MDADTRHQLKQNELAEALARLRHLDDRRIRMGLLALGAVLVLVLAVYVWRASSARAREREWDQLYQNTIALLTSAGDEQLDSLQAQMRALIDSASTPNLGASARVQLAVSYINEGLADPAQRPKAFEEAVALLQPLVNDQAVAPLFRAPALYALANAYESLGQFDKSKELHRQLVETADYDGSIYKQGAERLMQDANDLTTPIAFAPGEAPPPPPPPTQPSAATSPSSTQPTMADVKALTEQLGQGPDANAPSTNAAPPATTAPAPGAPATPPAGSQTPPTTQPATPPPAPQTP